MVRKNIILIIIVCFISSVIVGLLVSQRLCRIYARPKTKITVNAYFGEYAGLVYIAKDKGYFAKNGLDVRINDYEAGKLALEAFLAGGADMATCADVVFVTKSFDHPELRILASIGILRTNGIVGLKSHGIAKPQDLRGKKVGVTKFASADFFLRSTLPYYYLSPEDIEAVDLKPAEIIKAIVDGEIDAASTWEPNIYEIRKKLPENTIVLPSEATQDCIFLLIAKEGWLKDNPKAAKSFLKAIVQAGDLARKNPQEAKQVMQKQFNRDAAFMDYMWPKCDFSVTLSQDLILVLEGMAKWCIDNKLTSSTSIPNYLDFIYKDALEEIRPEAVTIIY